MTKATLSPSIHEGVIKRHMSDDDDPVMNGLFEAVKSARENASKAALLTEVVMANELETLPSRHKKARSATFSLLENATRALDKSVEAATSEIAAIHARTRAPAVTKDLIHETRMRELRERLAMLPEAQRKAVVQQAISDDDNLLLAAVLSSPAWLSGFTEGDLSLTRHAWQRKHFAADLDRASRLQKAVEDANRAGQLTIGFVETLTDRELVETADASAKKAADALLAAKA